MTVKQASTALGMMGLFMLASAAFNPFLIVPGTFLCGAGAYLHKNFKD